MPPHKPVLYDVGMFLRIIRKKLMGRDPMLSHRWEAQMSPRSIPPPNLPGGCSDKLSGNYYYSRDARRRVMPPIVVATNTKQGTTMLPLAASPASSETGLATSAPKTPGPHYDPPLGLNLKHENYKQGFRDPI